MKLVLFEIFGVEIYSYGFMIAIGILTAMTIFIKRAKIKGYDEDSIFNLVLFAIIGGVLGGKLLFIITEFKAIINNPSILLDFGYGFVIFGAIILGAITVYTYCRIKKWNTFEVLDLAAPSLAIGQGFGRIGCLLAGCCYGAETEFPISLVFPNDSLAPAGVHLHATQVYSSIFDFILAGFLIWYAKRSKNKGNVLAMYAIIYSIGRFLVEILRNDPRGSVGTLSTSQFISIFTLIFGIIIFNREKFKGREKSGE
ncbi:MAG: prolipoprotein diacylglyceryl transferase [Clostridium sp.]